jgi:predicted outer membrane lipoprotein
MVEAGRSGTRLPRMAQPARRVADPDEPPVDPEAIDRAYRYHRARRNAKLRRKREKARAILRFALVLAVLLALAIAIMLTLWHEVQQVFGL